MTASIRTFFLCLLAFAFPVARAYAAPSIQFSQTSVTVAQNNTFQVNVSINVDSYQVKGSDVVVQYNAADLSVISFTNGGFFPTLAGSSGASGRVEMHGYTQATDSKTGSGTFATITFKALKGTGSGTLSFICSDTDILTTSLENILSCAQLNTAAVTFSSGSNNPTSIPTQTPNNNNSQNTIPTCTGLSANPSSGNASLNVTLACSGVDPDGDITAAEFTFGDGTSQTVSKNVGSPGSLSVSHAYTTIGTLAASCRVRDNNQVFSATTDACRRSVTIRRKPTSGGIAVPTSPIISTSTPTPDITPSDPTPEPTIYILPTLYPKDETLVDENKSSNQIWWILGAAVSLIIVFLLLQGRKTPPVEAPVMQPPLETEQPSDPPLAPPSA